MNNKKMYIIMFDLIFWTIIIVSTINEFLQKLVEENLTFNIFDIEKYLFFVGMFVSCITTNLLKFFPLAVVYIGIRIAYGMHNLDKLDKIDFKNDSYYREIIYKYSPGVLSYIDDFKVDKKDIVATLMSLQLKRKIKIEDKINVIDSDEENLEENEKYILDKIKKYKAKEINISIFEKHIINDCIKNRLLEEESSNQEKAAKKVKICVIGFIAIMTAFAILAKIESESSEVLIEEIFYIFCCALMFLPFVAIVCVLAYKTMHRAFPYVRNKKAKDINFRIEGLRKYMKDYTLLDQKEYEDMIMWENYLIYSVLLGQNTKIVDEIMKKVYEYDN